MDNIHLIILAAGRGKRMRSNLPKVLLPLAGKPLLLHLLEAVSRSKLQESPTLIVGVGNDLVKSAAGGGYQYVFQKEQLGTGHAVRQAEALLRNRSKHIMVLYGDHPLVDTETIHQIAETHLASGGPLTMATVSVDNFEDWRAGFRDFGRIVRNEKGEIERIVDRKDATEKELEITEVNPSYFCFRAEWLWKNLKRLTKDNTQHEYYLTDLPEIAQKEGSAIASVSIDPVAALGANTPEQLAVLEDILEQKVKRARTSSYRENLKV